MLNDENTISYENNLLLASILCLLLVILFVLLLHVYARWLLAEGHLCGTSIASVFGPTARLRRSHTTSSSSSTTTTTYTYDIASFSSCSYPTKGLDQKVMESIPTFVYRPSSASEGAVLECAICLSGFEEKEVGRSLPRCSHAFHVDCIDMWLFCHSTCPICRANVAVDDHAVHERVGRDDGTNRTAEIESSRLSTNNNDDDHHIVVEINNVDSSSDDQIVGRSECSSSSSVLDCSLSRMLSRNRSESRVHPSSFIAIN